MVRVGEKEKDRKRRKYNYECRVEVIDENEKRRDRRRKKKYNGKSDEGSCVRKRETKQIKRGREISEEKGKKEEKTVREFLRKSNNGEKIKKEKKHGRGCQRKWKTSRCRAT